MNTKELRKYCIDNHRKMWHWLAENPDKKKKDWPGWKDYNNDPPLDEIAYCFLCCYKFQTKGSCYDCPLDWGITDMCMYVNDPSMSYYELYSNAITTTDKSKYAKIIANLPEKDDTEERLIIEEAMWRC